MFDLFDDCAKEDSMIGLVVGRVADGVHHHSGFVHFLVDHHVSAYEGIVGEDEQVGVGEVAEERRLEIPSNCSGEMCV